MAASSLQPTPEHWSELISARRQKRFCAEQVEAIKRSCQLQCGKGRITECETCYGEVLKRMRRRYSESGEREWFTERKAFLQELDSLFSDAKRHKTSVKSIEARIDSEKEAWYRWVLRTYPQFLAVCDDGSRQDELKEMLNDPDLSRDQVVEMMWQGIGKPPDWSERVDALAERVAVAVGGNEKMDLKGLYVDEFFRDQATGHVSDEATECLGDYHSNTALKLEEVISRIAYTMQENRRAQPQREEKESRLVELRRAKLKIEQNRLAKGQPKASEATAGEDLYSLPPCSVCNNPANASDVLSCSVCQMVTQMGGNKKLTIYCSEKCYDAGHELHVEAEHDCEARDHCLQLFNEDVTNENRPVPAPFACKDCFDEKRAALFCSDSCAYSNIREHRQRIHGGGMTPREEFPGLILAVTNMVDGVLERENPGLKMVAHQKVAEGS